jgi:superfamily I DNA/RNA helicase
MRILAEVTPTPEQLKILANNKPGFTLIRGAAGSGKTTTALLRLRHQCEYWTARRSRLGLIDPVRVLVLTYNRTLEGYIAELARQQVTGHTGLHLEVSTFGKWARDLLGAPQVMGYEDTTSAIRRLLKPIVTDLRYFGNEVEYLLGRFEPANLDAYLDIKREGRGSTPRVERPLRERLLNEVVRPYNAEKSRDGDRDWNDVAVEVTALAPAAAAPTWDIVVIDESQDFSANQVRAVLAHLSDPVTVTFIIDAAQRIYPRHFTWKEAGIDQFANRYNLAKNYRNTKQIAAFARPLVDGLPLDDDGSLPDFTSCSTDGPLPLVVEGGFGGQIDTMLSRLATTVDFTAESVAFLHPLGGGWFDYLRGRLRNAGIPFVDLSRSSVWPTGPEAVGLCTLHSAKGLEFDHVLMPGLNQQITPHGLDAGDGQLEYLRRLIAMGVGRARRTVSIGYKGSDPSTVIGMLDPATFEKVLVP